MKTFGLEEKHVFTLTITVIVNVNTVTVGATKAWKYLTWLSSHFDSFKHSCSVAQSVPFLTTDINNFRLPKGDFEIVQCSSSTCTAHVGFAWDKRGLLYHTMLSLSQI